MKSIKREFFGVPKRSEAVSEACEQPGFAHYRRGCYWYSTVCCLSLGPCSPAGQAPTGHFTGCLSGRDKHTGQLD